MILPLKPFSCYSSEGSQSRNRKMHLSTVRVSFLLRFRLNYRIRHRELGVAELPHYLYLKAFPLITWSATRHQVSIPIAFFILYYFTSCCRASCRLSVEICLVALIMVPLHQVLLLLQLRPVLLRPRPSYLTLLRPRLRLPLPLLALGVPLILM